jgi:predicted permease
MKRWLSKLKPMIRRQRMEPELRHARDSRSLRDIHGGVEAGPRDTGVRGGTPRGLGARGLGARRTLEEDAPAVWGWIWLEQAGQDLRQAGRMLRRRPAFTLAAVLTLMFGIGANTAIYNLLNALLLRTLPVERPTELVQLLEPGSDPAAPRDTFTLITQDTLQRGSTALAGVIASSVPVRPTEIEEAGERRSVVLQMVSDNYFDVLGVRAFRGRLLQRLEEGSSGEAIAVISEEYWRRRYGADPAAIGTRLRFAAREFTIAGVAAPGFQGAELDAPADVWVSFEQVVPTGSQQRVRGRWVRIMGRLQSGATLARAEAEAATILGRPVTLQAGATGYSALRRRLSQPLLLVGLVVLLVLLITCVNLANLMLAATAARERELAVRRALGASRGRVVRQLVTESLVLSAIGGLLALPLAHWVSAGLLSFLPPEQAPALVNLHFRPDARLLVFTAVLSCATCLSFSLIPALRATRGDAVASFRVGAGTSQRTRSWFSRGLLVSQVVFCTLLLTVAGMFLRSLQNLRGQDTGYEESQLLVADASLPQDYTDARRDQLIEELRERAAVLPGVSVAAFSALGQLSGYALEYRVGFPGRAPLVGDAAVVIEQRISPGFLASMGTAVSAGRDFTRADDASSGQVAIVNESFVRRFMLTDPIGAIFFPTNGTRSAQPMEIVGIVKDSKWVNLRDESPAMYYRPYSQEAGSPAVRFAVRTSGNLHVLSGALMQAAKGVDPRIRLSNVVPFRDIVDRTLVTERLVAQVSAAFGAVALLIASVGLYAILAYSVARRRREIGIRIAVGAPAGAVEWMILRESLTLLACGVAIGVPVAVFVTRLVSSMLFGLSPQDPLTIAAVLTTLTAATVAAGYLPARRAATVDPILALREE